MILRGSKNEIEEVLATWMKSHEGMQRERTTTDGAAWAKNRSVLAELKAEVGLTNSDSVLRKSGTTTHHFQDLSDDEVVFTIEGDRARIRNVGIGLMIAALGISLAGVVLAAIFGNRTTAISIAVFGPAVLGGSVVAGMRLWSSRVRGALARVIGAVSRPHAAGVYETIGSKIGSLFDRVLGSTRK